MLIAPAITLAPAGTTGNNTHASYARDRFREGAGIEFIVEVAGATPSVTWKIQGAMDADSVTDANATWYDVAYIDHASNTVANTGRTATAVGGQISFISAGPGTFERGWRRLRIVVSANTNITYRALLHPIEAL